MLAYVVFEEKKKTFECTTAQRLRPAWSNIGSAHERPFCNKLLLVAPDHGPRFLATVHDQMQWELPKENFRLEKI